MQTAGAKASKKRFDLAMLQGAQATYLLDITWAGQTFHLSRDTVVVHSTATGEDLQYEGSLGEEIEWEEALTLFSTSAEVQALPISVVLPVDVPSLVQRGHDLLQATGELSLWVVGTNYEDRRVLLRGRFDTPSYGYAGEPITTSIQSDSLEDGGLIPPASQAVNSTTWPNAAANALGASYPQVFGANNLNSFFPTYMAPGYLVDTTAGAQKLLIAGHRVKATTVNVYDASTKHAFQVMTVVHGSDALGQVVAYVTGDFHALFDTGTLYNDSDDLFVDFGTAGGMAQVNGTSLLTGAGDVLLWLFRQTTLPVNYGRLAAAAPYLNRFKLAGAILEGVSPMDFIVANLCPILPISVVNGPFGQEVVPWRYDATAGQAVDRIDRTLDPSIDLVDDVRYDRGIKDILNSFKLRYGLKADTGYMRNTVRLSAKRDASDSTSHESVYCAESEARYRDADGRPLTRGDEQESTVIYDDATAALVVGWWARAKALPQRLLVYQMGYDHAFLERGAVVTIMDADLGMTDQLALVDGVTFHEDNTIRVALRVLDDAAATLRASG